jgi:hypothetical protein
MWKTEVSYLYKTWGKIIILYILIFCIFGHQNGRQKILDCMISGILWVQSALNFSINTILICQLFPNIWTSPHFQRIHYLTSCCEFCPALYSRDINMYLVFSAFTSRRISLLISNKSAVFLAVWTFSPVK